MQDSRRLRIDRHALIMILCCLIPVAILGAIYIFKVPMPQILTYGLFLLCPLGHVLMMAMMAGRGHDHEQPTQPQGNPGPANRVRGIVEPQDGVGR